MALGVKNTKDLNAPWVSCFLYGPTRSGKTTAAATFPNPLFLVPRNEGSVTTLMGQNIPYIEITGLEGPYNPKVGSGGMEAVLSAVLKEYRTNPQKFPFDTIVVESVTHYLDLVVEELEEKYKDGRQLWGRVGNHLRALHNMLRSIETHTVYVALSEMTGNEEGKEQVGRPMITGKQGQFKLPSACDIIGYCDAGTGKPPVYKTHFEPFKKFPAGTRFTRMPKVIDNFTFAKIEPFLTLS